MNCAIAAAAGAMKDFDKGSGVVVLQLSVFAHPQFERLKARSAWRAGVTQV